jgi:hypothetical protein
MRERLEGDGGQDDDEERDHGDVDRRAAQLAEDRVWHTRDLVVEDQVGDGDGVDGGDEDCPGGHILGDPGAGVVLIGDQVDDVLERGVEHLGDEHERDRHQQGDHLQAREREEQAGEEHQPRDAEVDPHVALVAERVDDAVEGVVEAVEQVTAARQ